MSRLEFIYHFEIYIVDFIYFDNLCFVSFKLLVELGDFCITIIVIWFTIRF
jgi:hypothetical protein